MAALRDAVRRLCERAPLRHAVRRLCERALQQPGAQARSSVESARAMAALRHAVRRLCELALQQPGAQARSSVVAEEQRRLLRNGPSPGRRLMSTSSISGKTSSAGPRDELEREFKKKKEELFDLLITVKRAELYPQLSWEDIKIHRLITQLAAQVEPRPDDPIWRRFRGTRRLNDFTSVYTTVGFFVMLFFTVFNKEDGGKNNESNIVSDGESKNDMN